MLLIVKKLGEEVTKKKEKEEGNEAWHDGFQEEGKGCSF